MALTQTPTQFLLSRSLEGTGLMQAFNFDYPVAFQPQDFELLFLASQQELNRQLGHCPLTVVLYPSQSEKARQDWKILQSKLGVLDISTYDLGDLLAPKQLESLPHDGHPTAATQKILGNAISKALYPAEGRP